MTDESTDGLDDVDAESGSLGEQELADIRAALGSESPIERREGARTCVMVSGQSVEALLPLVDDLAPLLAADRVSIAQQAGTALLAVAVERPEAVLDAVPQIVTLATNEVNSVRLLGANVLGTLAVEHPAALADDVHRLLPVLHEKTGPYEPSEAVTGVDDEETSQSVAEHEQEEHRMKLESLGVIANVVVAVVEAEPAALFDHVDEFVELFDHDDASIAGAAVDAVAAIADADPEVAAPAFGALVDCLERDDERVQARAIKALGFLADDRAVAPLRELAETTDDEDVADLAAETAAFLEGD